ncbi:hypothetical protein LCGC14_1114220 [marine sediment metagenome]|uniref:Tail fiber domain-containing protein n=2 Tax=root TaxID=1 RepID=A0A831VQA2_9FLAO|nr:tail fiber domain-containing protein [Pricia antarctica]
MSVLTIRPEITSMADADWFHVVQVSDTSSSPQGTSKKIKRANVFANYIGFDTRYYTQTEVENMYTGLLPMQGYNKLDWDIAYSWGNHADENYLKADYTGFDSRYQVLTEKGVANGYVPLNASGFIDAAFLPDSIDDILEYADLASFPATGESGKLYLALDTDYVYRWSGSTYVQVGGGDIPVDSVFGRTGIITAMESDYDSFFSLLGHTHTASEITDLGSFTGFDSRYLGKTETAVDSDKLTGLGKVSGGSRFGGIPFIDTNGVMDIGKYIDFHETNADTGDNTFRITNSSNLLDFSDAVKINGRADLGGSEGTGYSIICRNSSSSSGSGSGTTRMLFSWSNHGAACIEGYKESTNTTGLKFYTELGFNSEYERLKIRPNGDAYFSDNVYADNFILNSDRRLKDNIEPLSGNYDFNFVSYHMKNSTQKRIGVIAQEVEKTNPEFVRKDEDGNMSVAYIDLLCAKVADQEKRIQGLETIIKKLSK